VAQQRGPRLDSAAAFGAWHFFETIVRLTRIYEAPQGVRQGSSSWPSRRAKPRPWVWWPFGRGAF